MYWSLPLSQSLQIIKRNEPSLGVLPIRRGSSLHSTSPVNCHHWWLWSDSVKHTRSRTVLHDVYSFDSKSPNLLKRFSKWSLLRYRTWYKVSCTGFGNGWVGRVRRGIPRNPSDMSHPFVLSSLDFYGLYYNLMSSFFVCVFLETLCTPTFRFYHLSVVFSFTSLRQIFV